MNAIALEDLWKGEFFCESITQTKKFSIDDNKKINVDMMENWARPGWTSKIKLGVWS